MSDATYWRDRAAAAEAALRRARSRVWISPARRLVLEVLGQLKPGESMTTAEVAARLQLTPAGALASLRKLDAAGLVERTLARGCHHRPVGWHLGHLVVLEELEGLEA